MREPTPQLEQERQQRLERSILEAHKASMLAHQAIQRAVAELGLDRSRKDPDE